ncbi:B12-binding domain-containing radical SAM protein [Candidatus Electrothrix sp.]|uniref:B12-binding domain-containing radical SAM protein n=1 Tax=Candidatus Electrothrix sp. TaxID=2170559 RepID=UPI0040573FDE
MFSSRSSNEPARILLIRPKYHTGMSRFGSIRTEPLELEYLARAVLDQGHEYQIWDGQFDGSLRRACKEYQPDLVAITGYYPARDQMLLAARTIRSLQPEAVIIIGGVHAELNQEDFQQPEIDLIVHSGGVFTFQEILACKRANWANLTGISWQDEQGQWQENSKASFDPHKLPQPDRSYFHAHKQRFSWLYHGPAALVKTGFGCPYSCSFCYCRLLNNGVYQARKIVEVVEEIKTINCSLIWLIDDTFLLDSQRLRSFAPALQKQGIQKKFIIYARADFICKHPEILPLLKEIGVIEVIIGLEAIDDHGLKEFNKQVNAEQNQDCVRLLRQQGIGCVGLFIMDQQARAVDFRKLDQWITKTGLNTYTISVFSPFPGTEEYPALADQLLTKDCRKWDLLHLVLPPQHLSRLGFMSRIWWLHAKLLWRNQTLRQHFLSTALKLGRTS